MITFIYTLKFTYYNSTLFFFIINSTFRVEIYFNMAGELSPEEEVTTATQSIGI